MKRYTKQGGKNERLHKTFFEYWDYGTMCHSFILWSHIQTQANTVNIKELTPNWMWPSDGVITDLFGTRQGHHKGIDIAAP